MKKQKKKKVLHPDDNFFKVIMRETENARAYLVNFYPSIADLLDLDSLQLSNTSFTNPKFKSFDSDIVYRCRFKGTEKAIYFSLLWEHKSEPEEYVAIQVGLYIMQALYTLEKSKDTELEPIIPLIFYNGKTSWQPKTITELFQQHPFFDSIKDYLPNFQFLFKILPIRHPKNF
ncbi:MAG: Rpn family recombination-promoting nuclease/putative transposase [Saprospiraceae bacterium]